jgi:hypothetical protein
LGQSRHEVDGFFSQARRLAATTGSASLILRCGYHHAWTTFWWFEDVPEFSKIYSDIENLIDGTPDVDDCESLVNLWTLMNGIEIRGQAGSTDMMIAQRGAKVTTELNRLAAESHRPNSSLQARSLLLMMRVFTERNNESAVRSILSEMGQCLDQCIGLGTFPALQFINRCKVWGNVVGDLPEYEDLFQKMCTISRDRSGAVSEGKLLFERGMQQLGGHNVRDALKHLGKARRRLYKDETLHAAARASLGCSQAYIAMDLFWAARMESMVAAHIAIHKDQGEFLCPREAFWSLVTLARIDLFLGKVPAFLAWYEAASVMASYLLSRRHDVQRFAAELEHLDMIFAIRIINLAERNVNDLSKLTETFNTLNLDISRWALMFRQGQRTLLEEEFAATKFDRPTSVDEFFAQFREIEIVEDVRNLSGLANEQYITYYTKIMGVEYRIKSRNDFPTLVLAENLLGIIEAAFALARWENLAFIVDRFDILLDIDDTTGKTPPESRFLERADNDDGHPLIWKTDMLEWLNRGPRREVGDYLNQFLFHLLFSITIDPQQDLEEELDHWHQEETFERALGLSPTCIIVDDLIGKAKYGIEGWRNPAATSQL